MKLTQVLLRKYKYYLRPHSFVRRWQYNNQWQIQRDRRIENFGLKEALLERGVAVHDVESILSPISPPDDEQYDLVETNEEPFPNDETHPLWQDTPAYSYMQRTRQPKGLQLEFSLALTNSVQVQNLPERISRTKEELSDHPQQDARLRRLIKTCFAGDATQVKLRKQTAVPFIGWHPVESKMRPRNQYDWKAMSWGWTPPRTYGIPEERRNQNLARGFFNEIRRTSGVNSLSRSYLEDADHRQFISSASKELLRFYFNTNFAVTSSAPLPPYADKQTVENTKNEQLPDLSPQTAVSGLDKENIYRPDTNHPITSLSHSHPFIHTVINHDMWTAKDREFMVDVARARALMRAFGVAVGQARLRFGADVSGVLSDPVCLHVVETDGVSYQLAVLQLNTLDLASDVKNIVWYHPETLTLMEFCGFKGGRVDLEGYDPEVYRYLKAMHLQGT